METNDLTLFRKLWVKRKYMWHPYSMRALSIWCIKAGQRREEVHLIRYLIRLGHCLLGGFSILHFLWIALINIVVLVGGRRGNLYKCNSGKEGYEQAHWKALSGIFLKCDPQRCRMHSGSLPLIPHRRIVLSSSTVCFGGRNTNGYVYGKKLRQKKEPVSYGFNEMFHS